MLETALLSAAAWLLIAAGTHRFRREGGRPSPGEVRALRLAAVPLLLAALLHCGTDVDGERWVRMLGGLSLGAVAVVVLLSVRASAMLAPVRWGLGVARRGEVGNVEAAAVSVQ